jgi:hypothetical protein
MIKNIFLFSLFFFTKLNIYSQVIVVDSLTKQPIPNVSVFNSDKTFINLTNIKGEIFINIDTFSIQSLSFSHISYENKLIENIYLKKLDTVFLSPKIQKLDDVVLISTVNHDYIKIKGYYRSYLYNDNIVFAYSDGIVEYYINTKNDKVKNIILSSRLLQKKYKNNIKNSGGIKVGNSINPGLPNLSMINYNINKIKNTKLNNVKGIDTISIVNNEKVRVCVNNLKFNDLKNIYKLFGVQINIISNQYTAEFSNPYDNITNLKNFISNNKKSISFKKENYKNLSFEENVQEFYVIESSFVSKNSFEKINTKHDLNCQSSFNEDDIIIYSKKYNFPLIPNFIKSQFIDALVQ